MHISAFQLLTRNEQITEIYKKGVFIGKQKFRHSHIKIYYQLYGFYIQLRYEIYRKYIVELLICDNVKFIEPMLPAINIDEILNYITSQNTIK